jgi:C4-dicarboxylate-specific signal transduction histidine kinase
MQAHLEHRVERRTAELKKANADLSTEITVREKAQHDLEATHARLLDTSRMAGMAEVATSVLHNVGNVLNSVNVSAALVGERVRSSRTPGLAKAVALIHEHDRDLAAFLTTDTRGKLLPGYLKEVAVHLAEERATILAELQSLTKNMEHIKEIVAMQQDYGRSASAVESLPLESLVEDALRLNQGALLRHEVEVVRDFLALVPIEVNRHKVLQILVNLIRNAKYALDESERSDRVLTLRTTQTDENSVAIAVIDNGVGISPEHLPRIFEYGFTTRKEGHGFGLHSATLAAKELGGSLSVRSGGRGKGATFVLTLPVRPEVGRHDDCRA